MYLDVSLTNVNHSKTYNKGTAKGKGKKMIQTVMFLLYEPRLVSPVVFLCRYSCENHYKKLK